MIAMEDWVTIRNLNKKGKSIKQIARLLGISRNTSARFFAENSHPCTGARNK